MSAPPIAPARPRIPEAAPAGRPARKWRRHRSRTFYAFVAPWILGFLLLTVVPMLYALWLSFTNYDALAPKWRYVGTDNYREAVANAETWASLGRTALFTAIVVPGTICFGLLLAVLVNTKVRGRTLYRSLFYLPAVVPPVAAALTFRMLFDRDAGAVNGVLDLVGADAVTWLTDTRAFFVLIVFILWGAGANMVISLAGLQGIPTELQDAAKVDGAGPWKAFRHISLPLLSPLLFFQVITGVIFAVQTFVPALLLSAGGPSQLSSLPEGLKIFMVHVYQQAFGVGQLGYASALLWMLFALLLIFTAVVFRVSGRWVHYAVGPTDEEQR